MDDDGRNRNIFIAAAVAVAVLITTAVAWAHGETQSCAANQQPEWDYYGVHWPVSLDDAKREFERRGYQVHEIKLVESSINANDARRYVVNAWEQCKCGAWEFRGNYSVGNASVYAWNGVYDGQPNRDSGNDVDGYGEDP